MKTRDFYQVSLKAILKDKDGQVLGLKGVEDGTFVGFYDLPGGRIDEDEFETSYQEILSREIKEEVGDISFKIHPKPVALGRHRVAPEHSGKLNRELHIIYIFFEADYLGGEIKISHEHAGYDWFDLNKISLPEYFKSGILEGIWMFIGK